MKFNLKEKVKSIKLSDYFELVKPTYVYLKITPHKSTRNYNSNNIAKAIAHTYTSINRRIRKEKKKLFFETNFKISYVIDIKESNANFYFIIPVVFKNIIIEKCKEIWSKATMEMVDKLEELKDDTDLYSLSYKKEDALSLAVDRKSNEPLNSILSVMDIMKDDDRIRIIYNFLPRSQFGWLESYNSTLEKIKEHKNINKKQMTFDYIARSALVGVFNIFEALVQVIDDFTGGPKVNTKESLYSAILGILEQQQSLSPATNKKKEATIINTQIAIQSKSKDLTRRSNNALSISNSYRTLDEDNELFYKKEKHSIEIEDFDYKIDTNTMSADECSSFIQVPGRTLLLQHNIKHINVEEAVVPEKLKSGYIELGVSKNKGIKTTAYIEDSYDKGSLPLVLVGSQGAGKSTFLANYYRFASIRKEGGVVLDFIKNCEMSDEIISYLPEEQVLILDLSREECIQSFAFNELDISKEKSHFRKNELANLQAQQVVQLVNAINPEQPLQSRMLRYLSSCATVVFSAGGNSIKEVVNCLENHVDREYYLSCLDKEDRVFLREEIQDLEQLHEYSKPTKDVPETEVIGTRENKIEGILDRISLLRTDFKLKYMFNKEATNNINFVDELEKGKVIIIKMPQANFKKHSKNVITTFLFSKIWLATEIRGNLHQKPKPTHICVDEVFQTKTAMQMLANDDILPQTRKFGCKFIFSCQGIEQVDILKDTLIEAGASFMFLTGTSEKDFEFFKNRMTGFEYEDLTAMEKYHSLNLIYYSGGYSSFITKLPKPIKNSKSGDNSTLFLLEIKL